VGVHDNFFRVGGDSISAIRLTAAVRKQLSIELPLASLFEHKTIANISSLISGELSGEGSAGLQLITIPALNQSRYPLSFAQQRMFFIERFEQQNSSLANSEEHSDENAGEDVSAYHIPGFLRLTDDVVLDKLMQAIQLVISRHESLTSLYQLDDYDDAYQIHSSKPIPVQKLRCNSEADMQACVTEHVRKRFDLANEPGMRVYLYTVTQEPGKKRKPTHFLLLLWHHIVIDGWSLDVFTDELLIAYESLLVGKTPPLAPISINYGDYAVWQRNYLAGEAGEKQRQYWQQQLSGVETLTLPTDFERPAKVDYRGADYHFTLDETLSNGLRDMAKAHDTTLYTVALAGLYVMLSKFSGQRDIVVGSPTDNRHHAQTQSLLGMFVNSLALRGYWDDNETVSGLIRRTHDTVAQAKANQDIPFEQLLDALNVERDTSRHPVFQVLFSVQRFGEANNTAQQQASPFERYALQEGAYSPAKFDLNVFLSDGEAQISGGFNYAIALFSEQRIVRFVNTYINVLQRFVAEFDQQSGNNTLALSNIDALTDQERQQLLFDFNNTDLPFPAFIRNKLPKPRITLPSLLKTNNSLTPNSMCG